MRAIFVCITLFCVFINTAGNDLVEGNERSEIVHNGIIYSTNDTLVTCERILPDSFNKSDKGKDVVIQDGTQRINMIVAKNDANNIMINQVHIPASVKEIGDSAFYYCKPKYIKVEWFEPYRVKLGIKSLETKEKKNTTILLVPYGTKKIYKKNNQWKDLVISEYPVFKKDTLIYHNGIFKGVTIYSSITIKNIEDEFNLIMNQKTRQCIKNKDGLGRKAH